MFIGPLSKRYNNCIVKNKSKKWFDIWIWMCLMMSMLARRREERAEQLQALPKPLENMTGEEGVSMFQ
jgi:hypothetical protein